jgi:hypothetical protein
MKSTIFSGVGGVRQDLAMYFMLALNSWSWTAILPPSSLLASHFSWWLIPGHFPVYWELFLTSLAFLISSPFSQIPTWLHSNLCVDVTFQHDLYSIHSPLTFLVLFMVCFHYYNVNSISSEACPSPIASKLVWFSVGAQQVNKWLLELSLLFIVCLSRNCRR